MVSTSGEVIVKLMFDVCSLAFAGSHLDRYFPYQCSTVHPNEVMHIAGSCEKATHGGWFQRIGQRLTAGFKTKKRCARTNNLYSWDWCSDDP